MPNKLDDIQPETENEGKLEAFGRGFPRVLVGAGRRIPPLDTEEPRTFVGLPPSKPCLDDEIVGFARGRFGLRRGGTTVNLVFPRSALSEALAPPLFRVLEGKFVGFAIGLFGPLVGRLAAALEEPRAAVNDALVPPLVRVLEGETVGLARGIFGPLIGGPAVALIEV